MKIEELNINSSGKKGYEETIVFLFKEYYALLCAYARRYVGRKDIAEEIVSETFFTIWKNRETLHITGPVKAYLLKAVSNNSLYYLRQLKHEEKLEDYFRDTSFENIGIAVNADKEMEDGLFKEELIVKIENAVNQLPVQQQKAFKLKRYQGKKNKEVAELMGLSIKTIEMHLSKAMMTLREQLIS